MREPDHLAAAGKLFDRGFDAGKAGGIEVHADVVETHGQRLRVALGTFDQGEAHGEHQFFAGAARERREGLFQPGPRVAGDEFAARHRLVDAGITPAREVGKERRRALQHLGLGFAFVAFDRRVEQRAAAADDQIVAHEPPQRAARLFDFAVGKFEFLAARQVPKFVRKFPGAPVEFEHRLFRFRISLPGGVEAQPFRVGIEAVDDIREDFAQALARL